MEGLHLHPLDIFHRSRPSPTKLSWSHALDCSMLCRLSQVGQKGEMMRLCFPKSGAVLTNSLSMITTLSLGSSPGLAAGDPAAGKQFFALHCSACHGTEPGVNKIGPRSPGSSAARADPHQVLTTHPPSRRQTLRGTNRRSISGSRTQWATSTARGWFSPFLTPQIARWSLRIWRL